MRLKNHLRQAAALLSKGHCEGPEGVGRVPWAGMSLGLSSVCEAVHACRLMKQARQQKWWLNAWWSVWVCLQKHVSPLQLIWLALASTHKGSHGWVGCQLPWVPCGSSARAMR